MNLNKEDVLLLIQEYQKQRLLWDPKDKWHFHKNKKNDAWEEIAKCVNIDAEDAKKKISSLLGSFRRERAKARKTVGTGKGAKDIYKSDWFAFRSFAFLIDKDEPGETISSENSNVGEIVETDAMSEPSENNESLEFAVTDQNLNSPECSSKRKDTPEVSDNIESEPLTSKTFRKPSTPKRKKRTIEKEDPRVDQAFKFLQQPIPEETSLSIYAKYLADRLDKFDPMTQTILKHNIDQLLFDAEMEKYRKQTHAHDPPECQSFTPSPSPSTFPSPASTPPFTTEDLYSSSFVHEKSLATKSNISIDKLQHELEEFVHLTKL